MSLAQVLENVRHLTNAQQADLEEVLQELWSGYGQLLRIRLEGAELDSVIVKLIHWEKARSHPRGWGTDFAHQRKVKSYQVEANWYRSWRAGGDTFCYLPRCYEVQQTATEMMIMLEDLRSRSYSRVKQSLDWEEIKVCLRWLAYFHGKYMQVEPEALWQEGTYWHLATRPQELEALEDLPLKEAAEAIDQLLKSTPFQTIVHGDAKLANFCFSEDGSRVAAVDFQYVGGGCGMKDVAYFIGSCLNEAECEEKELEILDFYFGQLEKALIHYQKPLDGKELEKSWRPLYQVAWADFHRFLKGWSPGHWKINSYSERVVLDVINNSLT